MNCDNASLLLYAVTDRSWLHGQTLYAQAEQALQGGATFLQLREKELDEAHFKEEAIALKALCKQYGVPFVLDDNVALAIETDADGVHVGQSDMAAGKVRELIGPDKILGVSAQTVDEALLAGGKGEITIEASLRTQAQVGSARVGILEVGAPVEILAAVRAEDGRWYEVTCGEMRGFVRGDLVRIVELSAAGMDAE